MTTSKLTPHTARKRLVIKLGGSTLEGLTKPFFENFASLQQTYDIIITHGGGPAINRSLAKHQVTSYTIDGIRVTSVEAIELVQTTLIGEVNPALVHQLTKANITAIGLNGFDGQLLQSTYLDKEKYGFVGNIVAVNDKLLTSLLEAGIVPVIACIGATTDGQALNINGDTVASEVALTMQAEQLLLVTDVDGIRINGNYETTATPQQIAAWIEQEHIYGGMIPKVQGALACLQAGIPNVKIVGEALSGTLIKGDVK